MTPHEQRPHFSYLRFYANLLRFGSLGALALGGLLALDAFANAHALLAGIAYAVAGVLAALTLLALGDWIDLRLASAAQQRLTNDLLRRLLTRRSSG